MNEVLKAKKGPASRAQFDWGPTTNKTTDTLREWVVYLFLLLLLSIFTWALVDSVGLSSYKTASEPHTRVPKTTDPGTTATSHGRHTPTNNGATTIPRQSASQQPTGRSREISWRGPTFFVQLGAFADEQAAEEMRRKAEHAGYPASMTIPDEHYDLYRLLMGPYQTEKEAEQWSRKLQDLDFPAFVIESP